MTEDARAEADRIVTFAQTSQQKDRIRAALAAAMRNHGAQAHHGLCESIGAEDEMMCDCGTAELRDALSALRARAGEGTA